MFRFLISLCLITQFCISQNWVNYQLNGGVTKFYYSQSLNKLIFGGNFNQIDGKYIPGVATFDGANFDTLGSGINWALSGSNIKDFAEYKGNLYMAGGFSYMGNTKTKCIAKWNGTKWDSLGEQLNSIAYALKVYNNELYVGGYFWKVGNTTVNAIVKYDGTNWIPIGNGIPFNTSGAPVVFDIEFFNNELYVAGSFSDASGDFQLAKFDGTTWSKVLQLNSALAEINSMELYNNALYIGGRFYKSSGDPGNLIAKFDGTNWISLDNGINASFSTPTIRELKVFNNKLFITGGFNDVNGNAASSIAYWNDTSLCALNLGAQTVAFLSLDWFNNTIYTGTAYATLGTDTVKQFASIIPSSLNFSCSIVNGIQENDYLSSINIFPNPTNSVLNIVDENNQLQNATIKIQNNLGQLIFTSPFTSQINLHNLSAGMYFLTITDKVNKKTFKIIKQ